MPGATIIAGLLAVLGVGVVRGFSGLDFSALTVAGFSLFASPAAMVPMALVLEVVASISLIRSATRGADLGWLGWLVAANLLFIPLGILLLAVLPETLLRLAVGAALFFTAMLLRVFEGCSVAPGPAVRAATGIASGLLRGVAASGGLAAAMLMTAARLPAILQRATMIACRLLGGPYTLLCAAFASSGTHARTTLLSTGTQIHAVTFAPTMMAGIRLGKRLFFGTDPVRFRRFVLHLLMLMSALGVARAVVDVL